MIRHKLAALVVLAALSAAFTFFGKPVSAAGGISVSPAFLTATVSDKQPIQDLAIGIRNNSDRPVQLHVTVGGIDQNQGRLLPTTKIDSSLSDSLDISPTEFVIETGQSINIKLHIQNRTALSPGGHYASVIITQLSGNQQKVGLNSAVSVSLFLTKQNGAIQAVKVSKLSVPHSIFSLPKHIDIDFYSAGNVLVVPRASIRVLGGSSLISKGFVNPQSVPVLPGKTITLQSNQVKLKRAFWPGWYSLNIRYRYDGTDKTSTIKKTFLYIPVYWPLAIALIAIASYYFKLPSRIRRLEIRKVKIVAGKGYKKLYSKRPTKKKTKRSKV